MRYLWILVLLGGCTAAVGDLNNFTTSDMACAPGGNPTEVRDLDLNLVALTPHVQNFFEADIIRSEVGATEQVVARIIYDPLQMGSRVIRVPSAVPPGDYRVDFYADFNNDRVYTSPPMDHTWSRPLCDDGGLTFHHIAMFEPLDRSVRGAGGDLDVTITNIPIPLRPQGAIELHAIADFDEPQTVGVYRRIHLAMDERILPLNDTEQLVLPQILDGGTPHRIAWFIDADNDGVAGVDDVICMREETPMASGLTLVLDMTVERAAGHCDLTELPQP